MIPLQLTIKGLYSYQEQQTIDFTRLTADGLFGIFGPVGCGKSSILEAITFALYGRTTRLNQTGDDRYYNMMNLKSDQLFIEFIFMTGKEQVCYKSVVKGRRNSKKFDDVRALDRNAWKNTGTDWEPVELTELEQAIGLSYDNFRRTIIIPQGQFQEFLQLSNTERTRMMKELFNLEKFEFYAKVTSLESKNNESRQNIEGQLIQLADVDEEAVGMKQQQLDRITSELAQLQVMLAAQKLQADSMNRLRDQIRDLQKTELELRQLQLQEPGFNALEKTIRDYETCVAQFKHLLNAVDDCVKRQKVKVEQIGQNEEKLKLLDESTGMIEVQLESIKPHYDKRDLYKKQADELGKLIVMKELQQSIGVQSNRLRKGTTLLNEKTAAIENLKNERAGLEGKLRELKGSLPDMAELSDIKIWHTNKINLLKKLKEVNDQIEKHNILKLSLQATLDTLLAEPLFGMLNDKSGIAPAQDYLLALDNEAHDMMTSLELEGNELRVKEQLQKFAVELTEGKTCPLCGSYSHPHVYSAEDLKEAHSRHQASVTLLKNKRKHINDLQVQLRDLNIKTEAATSYATDRNGQLEIINAEIDLHKESFIWDRYDTLEALEEAFTDAARLQKSIREHEVRKEETEKKLENENQALKTYQAELDRINIALTAMQAKAATISEQIEVIDVESYNTATTDGLRAEIKSLQERCSNAEQQHQLLTRQLEENRNNRNNVTGSLAILRNEHQQELNTLALLEQKTSEALGQSSYKSADEVRQILARNIMPEQEKKKLAEFRQQQRILDEKFRQLLTETNNQVYDPEAHQKLNSELEYNRKLSDDKNREVGKLTEIVKNMRNDLEQRIRLEEEQRKLLLRAENIKTLKSLFKASGFVNYVSSVYLQNLCIAANERFFRLTRQRLSLEIDTSNNFQVRDFMNGGKVRSVKTLSGGQTFQAALSLALALADNIQKVTESDQNFFFLDEGFGSLDRESLSIVFDTLKTLRKENRIVGVISHVEEMQQEIDLNLQVEHHEELGSIIHSSWQG